MQSPNTSQVLPLDDYYLNNSSLIDFGNDDDDLIEQSDDTFGKNLFCLLLLIEIWNQVCAATKFVDIEEVAKTLERDF